MKEQEIKDELKEIKTSYLKAAERLSEQESDIDNFKYVLKNAPSQFYLVWMSDQQRPPSTRPLNFGDRARNFLKGAARVFLYLGVGLLCLSGVLATLTLLLMTVELQILITLVVFSMACGIGGICSLGVALISNLLSQVLTLFTNCLDRSHEDQIFQSVNKATRIVLNDLTLNNSYTNTYDGLNVTPGSSEYVPVMNPNQNIDINPIYPMYDQTINSYQNDSSNQTSLFNPGFGQNFNNSDS